MNRCLILFVYLPDKCFFQCANVKVVVVVVLVVFFSYVAKHRQKMVTNPTEVKIISLNLLMLQYSYLLLK